MSLTINIYDDSLADYIEYEKELIRSVSYMNIVYYEKYKPICLGCLGIKYKNDGVFDQIDHISAILEKGCAKCDSIVAWYMAMYTLQGIETEPILVKKSEQELHAQLKVFEGGKVSIIDPSVELKVLNRKFCNSCRRNR